MFAFSLPTLAWTTQTKGALETNSKVLEKILSEKFIWDQITVTLEK